MQVQEILFQSLEMGGANCAIVGCTATRSSCKGLSFFKLPKMDKTPEKDQWRSQLISCINRSDKGFNPNRATICSIHFKQTCIKTGTTGKKFLIPGSLPTELMPTVETHKQIHRNPPVERSSPALAQKVAYYSFKEVKADAALINLPWCLIENSENAVVFGLFETDTSHLKYKVFFKLDFMTDIHIVGIPAPNLSQSYEGVKIKSYLDIILSKSICPGIRQKHLQALGSLPEKKDQTYFRHILNKTDFGTNNFYHFSIIRSRHCLLLSDGICTHCKDSERLLQKKWNRAEMSKKTPLKLNCSMNSTCPLKLKDRLKNSRQENKILTKKIQCFNAVLKKNYIELREDVHLGIRKVIENAAITDPLSQLFWEEQKKAFDSKSFGMRWHPTMLRLAILLHSRSPTAYQTLRKTGVLKLPGEATIRDYTNAIHPKTGFNCEVIDAIKQATKDFDEHERFVILLHDEMAIKSDLVYDQRSGEVVGFVNSDNVKESSSYQLATHVLVFFIVGINTNLKMSLGYFGTQSATPLDLYTNFWRAVQNLENHCGLKVIASTCDKASANVKLHQLHDSQIDSTICFKTINHCATDRFIYFLSDVPHLLKTVRNNIFKSGYGKSRLLWNNGNHIVWSHIVDLYNRDITSDLFRTHLTSDHINLTSHSIMNVQLAAQVLSKTVGSVMQAYGSKDSQETAKFILLMDRFFDCMNTRSLSEAHSVNKPDLLPYTNCDDPRFEFLNNEFVKYLNDWKSSVDKREGPFSISQRNKMFLSHQSYKGLVMTVNAFTEATRYLLQNGVKYVLSNRFCQDPLEEHFGRHRCLGHTNENPNLWSFGYQENKLRLQRNLTLAFQPRGNVQSHHNEMNSHLSYSPLKKKRKMDKSDLN
ncbi:Transposable element P transposase [Biomphalaria glabrata]|nr:Transposable element P transposase [Biomphalaria glabrata]